MTGKLNTKRTVHKRNLDDKYFFTNRWIDRYVDG